MRLVLLAALLPLTAFADDREADTHDDGCDSASEAIDLHDEDNVATRLSGDQLFALLKLREENHQRGGQRFAEDALLPILSVVSTMGVIALGLYWSFRKESARQATLRTAIDKGQTVDPNLLLGIRAHTDLRRGLILAAFGISSALFLKLGPWSEPGLWSLGLVPLAIGGAYLLVARATRVAKAV